MGRAWRARGARASVQVERRMWLVPGSKIMQKATRQNSRGNRVGAEERRIVPVHQRLIYPMIGQL